MAMEIRLPALGENIDSATVTKVLIKVGETIAADQPIVELDTDKASVDVPASHAGTVKEIRVKAGDVLSVGQVIVTLEESGAEAQKPAAKPEPQPPKAAPVQPPAPSSEQKPKQEQRPEPEQKPEPAKRQTPEPEPPPEQKPEVAASLEPDPETLEPPVQTAALEKLPEPAQTGVPAAPSLRRMARELGIDIHAVVGTGPNGWITKDDIRNYAKAVILHTTASGTDHKAISLPDFSRWGLVERKAMSSVRRAIAEHLQGAWSTIPHVTQFDTADITELEDFRESVVKKKQNAQAKLTITAIAMKVVSAALKVFPQFAVSLDHDKGEIVYKKYCHIGIAVDTEHGLLVPVIRDVDKKSISALSLELDQMAEKARSRKLSLEDMQGGTFTITNLGGVGGVAFTPIINSPEVAILGLSRSSLQPVYRDGEFKPRLMLPLALSFDHRVIDGADAARFLRWIAEAFEQPLKLVME